MLLLVAVFAVGQAAAGLLEESVSLLPDTLSVALSILAAALVSRPAMGSHTYGWVRVERVSQFIDGFVTLEIALVVVWLAVSRLMNPSEVDATLVLVFALVGVALYTFGARCIPERATALFAVELRERLAGGRVDFLIVAVSAIAIAATGWNRLDAIAALVVSTHVMRDATKDLRSSWRVLMEAAPADVDVNAVGVALVGVDGVHEVHDLHIWEISAGFPALSAHILIGTEDSIAETIDRCTSLLVERFGIEHVTLQVEAEGGDLLEIDVGR
ncbi:cation diffusion facilitator family transporter [Solirubrobacter soli]|uniref:cation diffusion facilitator family transporter n=1 Tax=Solirubrobacter soli TaxID=363832 RepID=UPI00069D080D|nr:cation diffusion facilitator family transporter [Solirubrobacter soli]